MKVVLFYHSLLSDWNHGNAHFLRGIAAELISRGHQVRVFEPANGWSISNLVHDHGTIPLSRFSIIYPQLVSSTYELDSFDLDAALDGAELVLVHEWNDHELVRRIGRHRASARSYTLLFHDTHHRAVTDPASMGAYELGEYDGVLAFGEVLRELYLRYGWAERAFTWHEAADTRIFRPVAYASRVNSLVWIGNWGDEERSAELEEFLIEPSRALGLRATVYGVRYPAEALAALAEAGLEYKGWLANYDVPRIFASHRTTVHVPRRPYRAHLRGIPTIRVFEALACGIPLISAPWEDSEHLFTPGRDFLIARDGEDMKKKLRMVLSDPACAAELGAQGLRTVLARHTCVHRVDELLRIHRELRGAAEEGAREQWSRA